MSKVARKKHFGLNDIKRLFWVIIARLDRNAAKAKRINAYCDERISYFKKRWEEKRIKRLGDLPEIIEEDRQKIIYLGSLYFERLIKMLKGKTLNLEYGRMVKYYDDPQKWKIYDEDLLKKSLSNLGYDNLLISEEIIIPEKMELAIKILKKYNITKVVKKIDEKALFKNIKEGKIDAKNLKGIMRDINQFLAVVTPNIEIREQIRTIKEKY